MGTAIDSSSFPSGISPMRRDRARLFVSSIDPFPRFFLIIVNEYYIKGRYDGQGFFLFSSFSSGFFREDVIQYLVVLHRPLNYGKRSGLLIFLLTIQKCSYIIARLVRC